MISQLLKVLVAPLSYILRNCKVDRVDAFGAPSGNHRRGRASSKARSCSDTIGTSELQFIDQQSDQSVRLPTTQGICLRHTLASIMLMQICYTSNHCAQVTISSRTSLEAM